jgi:excinuclease UvrABC helicase subunit UvrB
MRDRADNCVIICSIENLDAMGVHTGDSITVAPAQTLSDVEYQKMRDAAFACIRRVGVETGGSNVQFAVNPVNGDQVVIEMKPRVYSEGDFTKPSIAADPVMANWGEKEIQKAMSAARRRMEKAAENLEFMEAAEHRDEMKALEERLTQLYSNPL